MNNRLLLVLDHTSGQILDLSEDGVKMRFCPNCNLEYDDKYGFCHKCGSKLQEKIEQIFCPYCGNKIETDGEYCPFCGKLLVDAEPVELASSPKGFDNSKPSNTVIQPSLKVTQKQSNFQSQTMPQTISQANISGNNDIQQIEEESTSKSVLKTILRLIGGFILFLIITVIGKGLATAAIRNGYVLPFIGITLILIFVSLYLKKKE